jgi:hypothetical protein
MLKDLKRRICWVAITLAGFSQPGPMGSGAAVLIIAALLNAAARAIWLSLLQPSLLQPSLPQPSLPQPWRDRHHHELPSRRARVRSDVRKATLWQPSAGLKPARSRSRLPNSQEHHHAYP